MFSHTQELRDRVAAKQKELESRLAQARAAGRMHGRESTEQLQRRLNELTEIVADGWNQISETTAAKLNAWLDADEGAQDEDAQ